MFGHLQVYLMSHITTISLIIVIIYQDTEEYSLPSTALCDSLLALP